MQKIFKVDWDVNECGLVFQSNIGRPLCAWSTRNLVAFTTGYTESSEARPCLSTIFIHIMCPEYPWEEYQINTDFNEPVQHLMWDRSGTRLLAIDCSGNGEVFGMRKHMINCWEIIHEFKFDGKVVCTSWLDPGPKIVFDAKAGHANLLEKFPKRYVKSCLADIAGLDRDGFIGITESGVASIILPEKGTKVLKVQKSKLFTNRCRIVLGDMCFKEDGKVHVVLATDKRVVEFFVLNLRLAAAKVDISVEISPCIVPHLVSDEEYMTYQITCVKFGNEKNSEKILVCTESGTVTCLKYFEMKIEKATLHAVLQRLAPAPKAMNVKEWVCSKSTKISGQIACVALSRLINAGQPESDIPIYPTVLVVTKDGKLVTFSASLSHVSSSSLLPVEEPISSLTYSPNDACILSITESGNVAVFQSCSLSHLTESIAIKTCVNLFEYCLLTGSSPWDVTIFAARHGEKFLEQCCQYMRSNLMSQPSMTQERMSASHALIQAEIYKGLDGLYFGSNESLNFLMLKSIYCFLHSRMNSVLLEKESQVLMKIKSTCNRVLDFDLTKVLQVLDVKDVSFDSQLISPLQHLIQWIANYSIYICRLVLTSIKMGNSKQILQVISIQGLKMLREILCLIYLWGQSCPGWQPHFLELGHPSEVITQIFKLVSKLCLKLMQGDHVKDVIKEDMIPMRSHAMMYQTPTINDPRCGAISQCLYHSSDFDYYCFSTEEDTLTSARKYTFPQPLEQGISCYSNSKTFFFDALNHFQTSLMKGETLKQCIQCSCLTLSLTNPARSLLASWKEQWNDVCFCGGIWRALDSNKEMTDVPIKEEIPVIEVKSA